MPPLYDAEDYAALIAAVEEAAKQTGVPVQIEGYPPPPDPRLNVIKVTPDPGVIEVNIHPSTSWESSVAITTALYEEAHNARLCAEKFMLDGRHTGTGGGNHVVLGGITPADSPFPAPPRSPEERRALLAATSVAVLSLLGHVHRPDEPGAARSTRRVTTRSMNLRSRSQVRRTPGMGTSLWLVDRLYRNLLVDVSGNTHRAEICIDKLYSPDGPTGRLGLVEFRAFEMPPDARMSFAQQLLLRALVAWFWREPQEGNSCAGGPRCTISSCCRISSGRISSACSTI